MRAILPAALAALCWAAPAAARTLPDAGPHAPLAVRDHVDLWLEPLRHRRVYEPGDLLRLELNTEGRAYVAVVHLDPAGRVELLWPRSAYDRGDTRGRRRIALNLGRVSERWWLDDHYGRGRYDGRDRHRDDRWDDRRDDRWDDRWDDPRDDDRWDDRRHRSRGGIGYVLAVASDRPLDFGRFRDRMGWRRDLRVAGDPYRALRRVARSLTRGHLDDLRATDLYTYRVGRAGRYPGYACYDDWFSWGYGYDDEARWRGCDRVEGRLRREPDYFDWSLRSAPAPRAGSDAPRREGGPRTSRSQEPAAEAAAPRASGARQEVRARLFATPEARAEEQEDARESAREGSRGEAGEAEPRAPARPRVVAPSTGRPR